MKIFISYRRSDSQDIAARIADRLSDTPGIRKVFIDVGGIEPGDDFDACITSAIEESDICLILIGSEWTCPRTSHRDSRIFDSDDFVRREVAASLASGKRTIPILLDAAQMPPAVALPEDIRGLCSINAAFIRHASFDQDFERLEDSVFFRKPRTPLARLLRRRPILGLFLKALVGVAVTGALLLVLAVVHYELTGGRALEHTLGSEGNVWLFVITVLVLGVLISLLFLRRH